MSGVVIVDYGAGNVRSVERALERLRCPAVISGDPGVVASAARVVFPGVGEASAAMRELRSRELDIVIPSLRVPTLGICLGMQLMCAATEEGDTEGLGIFPAAVGRIPATVKVPHMGWNNIHNLSGQLFDGIPDGERMYFVHSYYVPTDEWCVAECGYHGAFAAAIAHDNFFGCQFHPEKSGDAGQRVLANFLAI